MAAWQTARSALASVTLAMTVVAGCTSASSPEICRGVVALGATNDYVGVLKSDGALWTWGRGDTVPRLEDRDGTFDPTSTVSGAFCFPRAAGGPAKCPLVEALLPATAKGASILADRWIYEGNPGQPPVLCAVLSDGTLTCNLDAAGFVALRENVDVVGLGLRQLCAANVAGAVSCQSLPGLGASADWELPVGSIASLPAIREIVPTGVGFCGRATDGAVWCWGHAFQWGGGAGSPMYAHRIVGLGGPALALASSYARVCALREGGAVLCWTDSMYSTSDHVVSDGRLPQEITGLPLPATAIVTQAEYACALLVDETVWCWGTSLAGSLGNGESEHDDPKPVSDCGG